MKVMEKAQRPRPEPSPSLWSGRGSYCACETLLNPAKGRRDEGSGRLASTSALVEDFLQVRIQEHSSGVQLLTDVTELVEGGVHFLKVLPGAVVSLWKQSEPAGFVLTELNQARLQASTQSP